MAISGSQKPASNNSFGELYTGFFKVEEILAVNPSNKERAELLGYEYDDTKPQFEYTGETNDGDKKVDIMFYLKAHKDDIKPIVHRITLENREVVFEKEGSDSKKYLFINQVGQTFIAEDENKLQDWFLYFQAWNNDEKRFEVTDEKKSFRKAVVGEEKLIRFMREALSKINQNDPESSLKYDLKQLFKGNVKEVWSDLQSPFFVPFVTLATVTTNKEGDKHYQNIYIGSNTFYVPSLPEDTLKFIRLGNFPTKLQKRWDKYKDEASGEYGAKGYFTLTEIEVYDASKDFAASGEAKVESPKENVKSPVTTDY